MYRNFVLLFSALAILFLVPSLELRAEDRIVLKDGNVVEGEIIRTTVRDITLKGRFGMITFPLKRVRRVRQDGKFWTPPETPEEEEEPSKDELAFGWGQSALKQRLMRTMQEIDANPLGQWTSYPKEPARIKVEHPYRLLKHDKHTYSDRLPPGPVGYDRVWVHRRERIADVSGGISSRSSVTVENGHSAYYWVPLYWHETSNRWLPTHPLESSFLWEENQIDKALNRIASARGRGNSTRIEALLDKLKTSPEHHEGLKSKLRKLTKVVAGEWGGDELLYRIYLKNLAIAYASSTERVELARSRRSELRQLISMVP